jgi:predicted RNase H-like HicB family nuclease
MEYVVLIERDPETSAVVASSPDFENVVYVGDPDHDDETIRAQFAQTLSQYFAYLRSEGRPFPPPRHRALTVAA